MLARKSTYSFMSDFLPSRSCSGRWISVIDAMYLADILIPDLHPIRSDAVRFLPSHAVFAEKLRQL